MEEKDIQKSKELEALLFIYGEAMPTTKILKLLELKATELPLVVGLLEKKLLDGALVILKHDASLQLVSRPQYADLLKKIITAELEEGLTPPALETLSIILYAGPVSRARIDYIRGVNSSFILRSLLVRGLVQRSQDPERQNAFLYRASVDLLKHLGLSNLEELPDFEKYGETLRQMKIGVPSEEKAEAAEGVTKEKTKEGDQESDIAEHEG
jgi:segregation and condensation protein B